VVLFRRAGSVRVDVSLGPWLHGVSRRIAARARAAALRRRAREVGHAVEPASDPAADEPRADLREELDEGLACLPTRYRVPIILCHLEGLTYQEAARRLGCPVGTVGVRLARGRELLRARLARRRPDLPAFAGGAFAAAPAALPAGLVDATVWAVSRGAGGRAMTAGLVSASAVSLAEGFMRSMVMARVMSAALVVLAAAVTVVGGLLLRPAEARQGGAPAARPQTAAVPRVEAPGAKPASGADDRTRRVRELIYVFRDFRVFARDEEWARTIRELATIGKDAVPELVAELDRTDRDQTLRSLAFTLRAIGDPRAVPALIRAIPKALRPPGSDCGVTIADPDLRAFMQANQNHKANGEPYVACGRPVNEILSTLERITGHREPPDVGDRDPLRGVFLGETPDEQAQQRALFEERRRRWESWWSQHRQEFVTPEALRSVERPERDEDLVEMAGVARYGVRFPTGPEVRLGPVRMLRLTSCAYRDGKSYLDFDTGRGFSEYEGMKTADWGQGDGDFGSALSRWQRQTGIDVRCQGPLDGVDLHLWLVDDSRWDTLEAEIRQGGPLRLGREATSSLVRFESSRIDFKPDAVATFLFTTREGGRGIVQVFPKDPDADRYRLRYRMWSSPRAGESARPPAAEPRPARTGGTPFGPVATATLERPAAGRASLLDLETGRSVVPPDFLGPGQLSNPFSLEQDQRFARWCRDRGIDLSAYVETAEVEAAAPAPVAKKAAPASRTVFGLIGLDVVEARILPQSFDEMTVEEACEILGRLPRNETRTAWMLNGNDLTERPDTFAFKDRDGGVGLLQMEAAKGGAGQLTIRYRLGR
jgi:RNA polymerase sigma factor (sigma-70 family)